MDPRPHFPQLSEGATPSYQLLDPYLHPGLDTDPSPSPRSSV